MSNVLHHFVIFLLYMNSNISSIVGKNIQDARKLKGLKQKEMANVLKMTQQQYSRFETGIYELNYYQIVTICKVLDIFPNDIFEDCLKKSENIVLQIGSKA